MLITDDVELKILKQLPKRTPWPQVMSQINLAFPTLDGFNWRKVFDDDPVLFASLLRGILGLEGTRKHTWGPRPQPSMIDGQDRLKKWAGEDNSLVPFKEALKELSSGMTEQQLSSKTNIHKSNIHRYLTGAREPDSYVMETVAKAFKKEPSYFMEYRILFIIRCLIERMNQYAPEASISVYQKLREAERGASS